MLKLDETGAGASRSTTALTRIAAALGCPISTFCEPPAGVLGETDELLRLWLAIEDEQDRAKVLSFLRSVAATAATREGR